MRRFVDNEYCSGLHRKLARTASARELRDARYRYGEDDYPLPENVLRSSAKSRPSFAGIAMLAGILLLIVIWMPQGAIDGAVPQSRPDERGSSERFWAKLRESLPGSSRSGINMTADFSTGLKDWAAGNGSGKSGSWVVQSNYIQPKELRLWEPSLKLQDYVLNFDAAIEQKAIGWVFRATDTRNYYAAKIVLSRPAPFPQSEIVRYAVLSGQEQSRVQTPLPRELQRGALYKVRVRIRGDRFETTVNGTVVDSWQDARLKTGGIGFFADKGEIASVLGVHLSEDRNILERIFLPALLAPPFTR